MSNRMTMPTTFQGIVDAMGGKDHVTLCNNTRAYLTETMGFPMVVITLHGHAIVRMFSNDNVQVRHCGYPTVTTFDRIKRFLPAGFGVTRQGGLPRILFHGAFFDDVQDHYWSCSTYTA